MIKHVELSDRVLRCEMLPDGPGDLRRTITVSVESGPPLKMTRSEADALVARLVVELMGRGVDVHGWWYTTEDATRG